jgi:hypothetical protein
VVSNFNFVRSSLGTSIQTYQPGLNVYYYVPRTFTPPAAIVEPASQRTINYKLVQGNGPFSKWFFNVLLVLGQVDEAAAQEAAGEIISPGSPLITALQATDLKNGFVEVTDAAISQMQFGGGIYTYARLTVIAST